MPKLLPIAILCLWSSIARADIDSAAATASLRQRLNREWQAIVDADKAFGWRVVYRGTSVTGDWVIHLGGWRYFFKDGMVRCRLQTDQYMTCGSGDSVKPVWSVSGRTPAVTMATLRALHRGIWGGKDLAPVLETIVSTPDADTRTSRRYRATVTLTTTGFALGEPQLVEEYDETCYAIHGCHATHWSCTRR